MDSHNEKPLISVLTPSWDRVKFLPTLIKSLKNQTFKKFEWIIGNDGSTDGTHELLLSAFEELDFRVTYINSSLRIGKAKMDNMLIDNAQADYLLWCDADDYFSPDALKDLYDASKEIPPLEKSNYIGVLAQNNDTFGVSQTFSNNNLPDSHQHYLWEELKEYITGYGTILISREHFLKKRFAFF